MEDTLIHTTKGSGLGLALVQHIMDAHGGSVEIDSEPSKGSTFRLLLPLAPVIVRKPYAPPISYRLPLKQ